jgi:acyl-CoA synthetase (AMP-forming)/AMP-acid ligase II
MRFFSEAIVDAYLADGSWTHDTWWDVFERSVASFPDDECLVDAANKKQFFSRDPRRLTWRQLAQAVDRCSELLFARGIRSGHVVGVQLPNSVELVISYLAITRLGAIISPYHVVYRRHEISEFAEIAGFHAIVTGTGFRNRDLPLDNAHVADDRPGTTVLVWGLPGEASDLNLDDILNGAHGDAEVSAYVQALQRHPADCVSILFTSGTTGTPKGVPRAHGDSLVSGHGTRAAAQLSHDDVVLAPMPLVSGGALSGIFLPWLLTGCRLVMHHPFDPEVFAAQVDREKVSYLVAPPAILSDMVSRAGVFTTYDLSSLRSIGSGSAPLSGWTIQQWEDHGVDVINFFGSTEGLQLSADRESIPDPNLRARYLPMPGSPRFTWRSELGRRGRSRLVDPVTEEEVTEPGAQGELRVAGPNIFSGYLGGDGECFDDQGYYRTGDLFERSATLEDVIVLVDRSKDLIIRGGMNISAVELETLLSAHPKVAAIAAVGRRDERLGERTCVFVVPRNPDDPPNLKELVDFLDEQEVATFKLPEFLEIIDALPVSPMGKVLKGELRRMVNGPEGVGITA